MTNAARKPSTAVLNAEQAMDEVRPSSIANLVPATRQRLARNEFPRAATAERQPTPRAQEPASAKPFASERANRLEPGSHKARQPFAESSVPAIPPTLPPPASAWARYHAVGAQAPFPIRPPIVTPYGFHASQLPSEGYSGPILREALQREYAPFVEGALRDTYPTHSSCRSHGASTRQWVTAPPSVTPAPNGYTPAYDPEVVPLQVTYYLHDSSVFFDCDYVTKAVPGRILWRLLNVLVSEGRTDFTNRELRHEPSLRLPPARDNLETRLYLLRKRLNSRFTFANIEKTGRGRFRLVVHRALHLRTIG